MPWALILSPHSLTTWPLSSQIVIFLSRAPLGCEWPFLKLVSAPEDGVRGQGPCPHAPSFPSRFLAWLRALEEAMFCAQAEGPKRARLSLAGNWESPRSTAQDWAGGSCVPGLSQ
ncbi:unnamed protein product [Gulo gulo]|uniref:Uncharacterized protein n=1 Tax=Gulo gulo TaxID=48420 RepID=A0A9X9LY84_GULGU|nr:unnamed protein product [Gulo gulo]